MTLSYNDPLSILSMNIYDNVAEALLGIDLPEERKNHILREVVQSLKTLSYPMLNEATGDPLNIEFPIVELFGIDREGGPLARITSARGLDNESEQELREIIKNALEKETVALTDGAYWSPITWGSVRDEFTRQPRGVHLQYRLQRIDSGQRLLVLPVRRREGGWVVFVAFISTYPKSMVEPETKPIFADVLDDRIRIPIASWLEEIIPDILSLAEKKNHVGSTAVGLEADLSYIFLRQLLRRMHAELSLQRSPSVPSTAAISKIQGFDVVYVIPKLHKDLESGTMKVHYRYVLTPQQIDELKRLYFTGKGDQTPARQHLQELRKRYSDEIVKAAPEKGAMGSPPSGDWDEANIKEWLTRLKDFGYDETRLRSLAFRFLALKEDVWAIGSASTDKAVDPIAHLVNCIEKDWSVPQDSTFLIDAVFNDAVPEIIEESFINHPLGREKIETKDLIDCQGDKLSGYPLQLHQLETLIFPQRMFMFPVVASGVPVMMCAFDADKFSGKDRMIVKSVIDRYTDSLLVALLEFSHSDATKHLRDGLTGKWEQDRQLVMEQFAHLLFLFSSKKVPIILGHKNGEVGVSKKDLTERILEIEAGRREDSLTILELDGYFGKVKRGCACGSTLLPTGDSDNRTLLELYLKLLKDLIDTRLGDLNKKRSLAVSVVNARNMSHNIGSHVLSRMAKSSRGRVVDDADSPFLADFITYLQSRMEFLSDLAIATPASFVPCKFRSEVIEPWIGDKNKILLDRISGIAELKKGNLIFDTSTIVDALFASPYGPLGFHAVYVILENIIRNTSKHGGERLKDAGYRVKFSLNIKDASDHIDLLVVTISDSLKSAEDRVSGGQTVVERLKGHIEAAVLRSEELRPQGWGMLEMKIAAAYLRGVAIETLDAPHWPKLLEVGNTHDGNLEYSFYLRKPQEVLIFDPMRKIAPPDEEWKARGVEWTESIEDARTYAHRMTISLDDRPQPLRLSGSNLPTIVVTATPDDIQSLAQILHRGLDDSARYDDLVLFSKQLCYRNYTNEAVLVLYREHETEKVDWRPEVPLVAVPRSLGFVKHVQEPEPCLCLSSDMNSAPVETIPLGQAPIVVLDRHTNLIAGNNFAEVRNEIVFLGKTAAYEGYQGSSVVHNTVELIDQSDSKRASNTVRDLLLSEVLPVFIVDERVHQDAHSAKLEVAKEGMELAKILEAMNVFLPPKKSNPATMGKKQLIETVEEMIGRWEDRVRITGLETTKGFVVIHLTILERCFENAQGIQAYAETLRSYSDHLDLDLVITTGRGASGMVQKTKCRYLPLTELMKFTVQEPSKHHLASILLHTRGIK